MIRSSRSRKDRRSNALIMEKFMQHSISSLRIMLVLAQTVLKEHNRDKNGISIKLECCAFVVFMRYRG
jgi:hypothetical protein